MTADFTRDSFEAANRFRRVLLQQGRVQLDADFNEQSSILLRQGEILTTALLGRFGGPRHIIDDARRWTLNRGFLIEVGAEDGFKIGAGRYFVDGLLCENFAEQAFLTQPDFPTTDDDDLPDPPFLVYLEVFERPLAAIQDEAIVEPALEGLDTAARSRLIWQVKVLVPPAGLAVPTAPIDDLAWNTWLDILDPPGRGILRARTNSDVVNDGNPCIVPITSAFRGEDNQLYRVEVHDGGDLGDATFKWSRENASVLFPIEKLEGTTVTVTTLGRDRRSGLKPGDWVEVIDDHRELRRDDVVPLFQVENILRDQRLVVLKAQDDVPLPDYNADDPRHPLLRRWDGGDAKPISEEPGRWLPLENGVEVQFRPQSPIAPRYRPGDFWLVPARVALGDVIWPREPNGQPRALPPRGITRHFAPLAGASAGALADLRRLFDPLGLAPPAEAPPPSTTPLAPRTRTK